MTYYPYVANDARLTKADLTALKTADRVMFSWRPDEGYMITCSKDADPADPWRIEHRHEFTVSGHLTDYSHDDATYASAYYHESNSQYNEGTWTTIRKTFREGDELVLQFAADAYQSDSLKAVGFHADTLTLTHKRNDKRLGVYLIGVQMSQSNLARMIRQAEYSFAGR